MNGNAFELAETLHLAKVEYILSKDLWAKYDLSELNLQFSEWNSAKYLNVKGDALNEEVNSIPNVFGGLYLFYVKCQVVPGMTEFPFYIGRAQKTASQNLRKRVREYFQHFQRDDERPKIYRMLKTWGEEIHVAYHVFETNPEIVDLEKKIINSMLLPMNDQIPPGS